MTDIYLHLLIISLPSIFKRTVFCVWSVFVRVGGTVGRFPCRHPCFRKQPCTTDTFTTLSMRALRMIIYMEAHPYMGKVVQAAHHHTSPAQRLPARTVRSGMYPIAGTRYKDMRRAAAADSYDLCEAEWQKVRLSRPVVATISSRCVTIQS